MAAAAIVNLISTGSAGLGISKASSVKGALLLQLCLSSWIFFCQPRIEAGLWKFLTASYNALSGLDPSRSLTCYSFPELNIGCCYTGGQDKLRLQVSTEEFSGGDTLWFAL